MNEDLISRSVLSEKLQAHHDFFVNAWGGFSNLPTKDKARVDEITNCIAEVMNAPAVDAVEVVRCKDCIIRYDLDECPMCFSFRGKYFEFTQDDGFCHRGERRADDES